MKLGEGKMIRGHIVVIVGSRHIICCDMDGSGKLDEEYHLIGEEGIYSDDEFGSFDADDVDIDAILSKQSSSAQKGKDTKR